MNNLPKLFISIRNLEIYLIVGINNEQNSFELLEKLIVPINGISENSITDLDKIANILKRNILSIEQKINFTFKDIIVILNNFDISFLNLSGFKKLNGTQISKENITYILNSLKSYVDKFEENKKILHIFNSEYCLDKKKLDNLPIGLFGDFYSHELSFNLINTNDYKNIENILKICNLKIKKILIESFVKGSFFCNSFPETENFFHIQIKQNQSKIFFVENCSIKFEQKFNFGSEIILKDISKVISLKSDQVEKIIKNNKKIHKISDNELLEKDFFENNQFRKVKKKLIHDIAKARIEEMRELIFCNNINFKKSKKKVEVIFLEISSQDIFECFQEIFIECFSSNKKFQIKNVDDLDMRSIAETASNIDQFGWKKEAIPVANTKSSFIKRIFKGIFE
jgi:cell division protein FtsA